MTALVQRSFAGGEIAPAEYGRVDLVKYATGLATMRNWFTQRHGGSRTRPGTKWVCHSRNMDDKLRLIPFKVSQNETYMHLHSDGILRVVQNGALVEVAADTHAITGATQADPCVLTIVGHTFVIGDEITVRDVVGMIELNGRNFKISNTTASTVTLDFLNDVDIDSTGFAAYVSGGTAAKIFETATVYSEAQLAEIRHSQTAAIMTLTEVGDPVQNLTRIAVDDWNIEEETFLPKTPFTENAAGVAGGGGSLTFKYKVTSIDPDDGQESLPAVEAELAIGNITQADPVVVDVAGHAFVEGDTVELRNLGGASGSDELNNRRFTVTNPNAGVDFELKDEDGTGYVAYVSGGDAAREDITILSANTPSAGAPHVISWDAQPNIKAYSIYRALNGVYGFIGTSVGTTFNDTDIAPDTIDTPPEFRNPFFGAGNYPATSGFYQQRRGFGRVTNDTEKVDFSETGDFKGFRTRRPLQDTDAVRFKLEGRQINDVQHIVTVNGKLVILTDSAEWLIRGDSGGTLTPIEINSVQQSANGSNRLAPIIVSTTALYVQALASQIFDLNFSDSIDGFGGGDLTVNSAHLFEGRTIVAWDFQKIPHSIVWMVLDNGQMIGMTYKPSEKLLAFHRHDVQDGLIEDVAVIVEGVNEAVYMVVKYNMDITGTGTKEDVRAVERMTEHFFTAVKEAIVMDSAVTIDGRNTDTTHTMTLSGGTDWDNDETLTLTSSDPFFLAGMKDKDHIHITGTRDTTDPVTGDTIAVAVTIVLVIEAVGGSTTATVRPDNTIPTSLRNVATSSWGHAVLDLTGLWNLEAQKVSIFSDGVVVASANNRDYDDATVANGKITLQFPRVLNHIGRPIIADMETLDIDTVQGETMADKKKIVNSVTLHLEQSSGLWVGPKAPDNDVVDAKRGLAALKIGSIISDDPVEPVTDQVDQPMIAEYSNGGRTFIRNLEPVPAAVLQIVPRGLFPQSGVTSG